MPGNFVFGSAIRAAGFVVSRLITQSRLGRVIVGIRDAEARARFLGYRVEGYKLFVFTVSAMMAGLAGALFHLVNHAVCKSLLFLDAGAVERAAGTRDLTELGGLGRVIPVASRTSLIASLSISGVPPFGGFWSKLLIVVACIEAGHLGLAIAAVLLGANDRKLHLLGCDHRLNTTI